MFRFGVNEDEDDCESATLSDKKSADVAQLEWKLCIEMSIAMDQIACVDSMKDLQQYTCGECVLTHVDPQAATTVLLKDLAELEYSDLLPARYEGGLKVWECTHDLLEFLQRDSEVNLAGKTVLDLGCGAGLLGTFALVMKGATVHFQDYNEGVISALTIPNVLLNVDAEDRASVAEECRFFAGDWATLADVAAVKYDVVLSAETVYNADNHGKLCAALASVLKKTGVAYLAAKSLYFGCSGGLRQFEETLQSGGILQSCVVWKCTAGVQREILRITFKKNKIR